jgi:predicted DCC family thiol-disulfide oxidoreductase YuxK
VLLVWPDETLSVVRVLAAVLLILWGAATLGEAFQSPIRDNVYRRQLDQEVRRLI